MVTTVTTTILAPIATVTAKRKIRHIVHINYDSIIATAPILVTTVAIALINIMALAATAILAITPAIVITVTIV